MPGYMMHLCEAQYILDKINYSINTKKSTKTLAGSPEVFDFRKSREQFMLGAVIPDAVEDKSLTHFRPKWQNDLITKYPDLNMLLAAHPLHSFTIADMGVLSHLHMDSLYVNEFWPRYFKFEDKDNNKTEVYNHISHVRMLSASMQNKNTVIPLKDFFSSEYFYGDYDITNIRFQSDFRPAIPQPSPLFLSITECSVFSAEKLTCDLAQFALSCDESDKQPTRVFPYADLKGFVIECGDRFISLINDYGISI